MEDTQQQAPADDQVDELEASAPDELEAPAPPAEEGEEEPRRFAVYDLTLLRFLPGVHASKRRAQASAKEARRTGRDFEVRQV